jgi:hypothetical protein
MECFEVVDAGISGEELLWCEREPVSGLSQVCARLYVMDRISKRGRDDLVCKIKILMSVISLSVIGTDIEN